MEDGKVMPSVTDRATTKIIRTVKEAATTEVVGAVDDAVKDMYESYKKSATDKDSSIVRKATESYMANSAYAQVVG